MPPDLAPIIELRAWYENHSVKHKHLAQSLKLSPQQLAELFSGRNQPTGAQMLAIIEFLRTNTMTTVDQPKTLTAALDRIEVLTAELKELKAAQTTTVAPVSVPKPPAATVTPPIAPAPTQPPTAKTIDQMTSVELTVACDEASQAGDKAAANRFYRAYSERKANR
jgi:hypothetical protein